MEEEREHTKSKGGRPEKSSEKTKLCLSKNIQVTITNDKGISEIVDFINLSLKKILCKVKASATYKKLELLPKNLSYEL